MCEKTKYKIPNPRIDKCIRNLINELQKRGIKTKGSCCGHNKYDMSIICENESGEHYELLSNVKIPRKRNFYKRDKQGHYYIPELYDPNIEDLSKVINLELEKVPLAVIYKQDGHININFSKEESKNYEIFGFLKCLVNKMEEDLTENLESTYEDENGDIIYD